MLAGGSAGSGRWKVGGGGSGHSLNAAAHGAHEDLEVGHNILGALHARGPAGSEGGRTQLQRVVSPVAPARQVRLTRESQLMHRLFSGCFTQSWTRCSSFAASLLLELMLLPGWSRQGQSDLNTQVGRLLRCCPGGGRAQRAATDGGCAITSPGDRIEA